MTCAAEWWPPLAQPTVTHYPATALGLFRTRRALECCSLGRARRGRRRSANHLASSQSRSPVSPKPACQSIANGMPDLQHHRLVRPSLHPASRLAAGNSRRTAAVRAIWPRPPTHLHTVQAALAERKRARSVGAHPRLVDGRQLHRLAARAGPPPATIRRQRAPWHSICSTSNGTPISLPGQVSIPAILSPVMPAGTAIGSVGSRGSGGDRPGRRHSHRRRWPRPCLRRIRGRGDSNMARCSIRWAPPRRSSSRSTRPIWDPELGRMGYTQGAHVAAGKYYGFGGLYTSGASVDWIRSITGREDRMSLGGRGRRRFRPAATARPSCPTCAFPVLPISTQIPGRVPGADHRYRPGGAGARRLRRDRLRGARVDRAVGRFAGSDTLPEITVIGGSARNELLLQIKASVTNRPHQSWRYTRRPRLGGALLGGLAAGIYRDAKDVKATVEFESTTIEPDPEAAEFYEDFYPNRLQAALRGAETTQSRNLRSGCRRKRRAGT